MEFVRKLFDTDEFVARWSCGDWPPALAWTHMVTDFLIFLAYAAIPASLFFIAVRRRDFPKSRLLFLFVAFILSCGLTHLVEAFMFYFPVYRFSAVMKVITATVSLTTAVVLVFTLPSIMDLPGMRQLNEQLEAAIAGERIAKQELERTRDQLEDRASQMTLHTRRYTDALAAALAVACRWELESGRIVWDIGFADAIQATGHANGHRMKSWQDLLGPDAAGEMRRAAQEAIDVNRPLDVELPVDSIPGYALRMSASPEAPVAGQPRMMIGMFRIIPRRA